eukprot:g3552.t1
MGKKNRKKKSKKKEPLRGVPHAAPARANFGAVREEVGNAQNEETWNKYFPRMETSVADGCKATYDYVQSFKLATLGIRMCREGDKELLDEALGYLANSVILSSSAFSQWLVQQQEKYGAPQVMKDITDMISAGGNNPTTTIVGYGLMLATHTVSPEDGLQTLDYLITVFKKRKPVNLADIASLVILQSTHHMHLGSSKNAFRLLRQAADIGKEFAVGSDALYMKVCLAQSGVGDESKEQLEADLTKLYNTMHPETREYPDVCLRLAYIKGKKNDIAKCNEIRRRYEETKERVNYIFGPYGHYWGNPEYPKGSVTEQAHGLFKVLDAGFRVDVEKTEKTNSAKYGSGSDKGNGSGELGSLCIQCSNPGKKRCARCRLVNYCSRECQEKHWPLHKKQCKKLMKIGRKKLQGKKSVIKKHSTNNMVSNRGSHPLVTDGSEAAIGHEEFAGRMRQHLRKFCTNSTPKDKPTFAEWWTALSMAKKQTIWQKVCIDIESNDARTVASGYMLMRDMNLEDQVEKKYDSSLKEPVDGYAGQLLFLHGFYNRCLRSAAENNFVFYEEDLLYAGAAYNNGFLNTDVGMGKGYVVNVAKKYGGIGDEEADRILQILKPEEIAKAPLMSESLENPLRPVYWGCVYQAAQQREHLWLCAYANIVDKYCESVLDRHNGSSYKKAWGCEKCGKPAKEMCPLCKAYFWCSFKCMNETKHKDSCLRVEAATPVQFKTHLDELVAVPEDFKLLSDFMKM